MALFDNRVYLGIFIVTLLVILTTAILGSCKTTNKNIVRSPSYGETFFVEAQSPSQPPSPANAEMNQVYHDSGTKYFYTTSGQGQVHVQFHPDITANTCTTEDMCSKFYINLHACREERTIIPFEAKCDTSDTLYRAKQSNQCKLTILGTPFFLTNACIRMDIEKIENVGENLVLHIRDPKAHLKNALALLRPLYIGSFLTNLYAFNYDRLMSDLCDYDTDKFRGPNEKDLSIHIDKVTDTRVFTTKNLIGFDELSKTQALDINCSVQAQDMSLNYESVTTTPKLTNFPVNVYYLTQNLNACTDVARSASNHTVVHFEFDHGVIERLNPTDPTVIKVGSLSVRKVQAQGVPALYIQNGESYTVPLPRAGSVYRVVFAQITNLMVIAIMVQTPEYPTDRFIVKRMVASSMLSSDDYFISVAEGVTRCYDIPDLLSIARAHQFRI